jgi:hypothetical protein
MGDGPTSNTVDAPPVCFFTPDIIQSLLSPLVLCALSFTFTNT